ncbi:intraflagellar transport-associated protein isoform X1 [Macrotis lagotis]|uniref:intraflagellar transport-associated protein isoform X1 n=1 Tax=Macrotis lagotis TaxID=92651 RepID=UPI003D6980B3
MPVQLWGLGIMDEDQLTKQVLDQFINCHNQTYEEFLNTFTHLSKDHQVIKNQRSGTDSAENNFAQFLLPNLSCYPASQSLEEEQIMIDEGQKVGISIQGDLNRAGKLKVDNFLDLEDFDMDEETHHKLCPELLLPGAVEEEVHFSASCYTPSFDQHSHPEPKIWPTKQPMSRHLEEVSGDEVQPFTLDEDFDYDNVMLTPKFSSDEMKTVLEKLSRLSPNMQA